MRVLLNELMNIQEIGELVETLKTGAGAVAMSGLSPVLRAEVGALLATQTEHPLLVICGDDAGCAQMARDIELLSGMTPVQIPARELQFRAGTIASREWEFRRIASLHRLAAGRARIAVSTPQALMQRCLPKKIIRAGSVTIKDGDSVALEALTRRLTDFGYARCEQVEGIGQFALRGGILDVFGPAMDLPVRIEFFGDDVDAMGAFDPATQRRVKNIKSVRILPAAEVLPALAEGGSAGVSEKLRVLGKKLARKQNFQTLCKTLEEDAEAFAQGRIPGGMDRYAAAVMPEFSCPLDYFSDDTLVCISDSARALERTKAETLQYHQDCESLLADGVLAGEYANLMLSGEELWARLARFPGCMLTALPTSRYPIAPSALLQVTAKQLSSYGGSLETAASDIEEYMDAGYRVLVLCGSERRGENLRQMLAQRAVEAALDFALEQLPLPGHAQISLGALSSGMEYPSLHLAVLTEGQLTAGKGKKKTARQSEKSSNRQKLQSYTDLKPGDLVVHTHHGVGRFVGMVKMTMDGVMRDYIKIAYAGSDCLYVPATQLDLVSKYIGGGENEKARLAKLGGSEWARYTSRAKAAAKDLAKGLVQLYARRQREQGFAFSPDSPWQKEFEDDFEYVETDDQLRCIREVKGDMERPIPMDRLLCGDVGYGKTEVALRAVMKCVLDGKQAAILVPTTVLAQQHYATAKNRFRSFPVNIAVLSRFQTGKESKRILTELQSGGIDLLVGTHRLLQKNIAFKDLGLLVIDEEQRFGVSHKERLKQMAKQVDVLTLSATPIPRTLNMALSGVRDMSTLEAPPMNRQPVQTYVLEHDWGVVADAIRREIQRGGQVYYLHNQVESIDHTAAKIRQILGDETTVAVAHGKLNEQQLSEVMGEVIAGQAQVLVCTTIIETGVDIPNVNTLIIEDADRLGLAQLHQIRGRVGRSGRRAYAYMTFRRGKILSETAEHRLSAIREYVEFGSGFKIAMRDLEIRGAGNLLGPEQSGFMMNVGYDLYLKLLEEAVLEEQGEPQKKRFECTADLNISANIPENYVPSASQRMDLYRRIAAVRGKEDAGDLTDEMIDRYGEPPPQTMALLDVALLRAAAAREAISDITQKGRSVLITFGQIDLARISALCAMRKYKGRLLFSAGGQPYLTLRLAPGEDVLREIMGLIDTYAGTACEAEEK